MSKIEQYRAQLRAMEPDRWEAVLLRESGLPGPHGNIELAQAVADVGDEALFLHLTTYEADVAPTNDPREFLAFCGVVGLGRLLAEGHRAVLSALRRHAADPRWRLREGVAMALQRWGMVDMPALLAEMAGWSEGDFLEQRAAIAGLCEPVLLRDPAQVEAVLAILNTVTMTLTRAGNRKNEGFKALRKGLAYCWSVAVAASPEAGKRAMAGWFDTADPDVRWVMKENLKKKRLERMDTVWVAAALDKIQN
jgi:hypothetical protein